MTNKAAVKAALSSIKKVKIKLVSESIGDLTFECVDSVLIDGTLILSVRRIEWDNPKMPKPFSAN